MRHRRHILSVRRHPACIPPSVGGLPEETMTAPASHRAVGSTQVLGETMMAPASRHGRTVVLLRGRQGAIVPLLDGARSPTVGRWHAGGHRTVVLLRGMQGAIVPLLDGARSPNTATSHRGSVACRWPAYCGFAMWKCHCTDRSPIL